ncbi:MAG: c-type cytochrome [Nitrospiria bacterium]
MDEQKTEKPYLLFSWVFILIFSSFSQGCTTKETPLPDHLGGKIYQGRMRLDVKCHGCHGWLGEGGRNAPPLVQFGRTISHDKFVDAVIFGRGSMPAFESVLSKNEILEIIDWLEKIPQ